MSSLFSRARRGALLTWIAAAVAGCPSNSANDTNATSTTAGEVSSLPAGSDLLAAHAAACGGVAAASSIRSLKIESGVEIGGQAIRADAVYQWRNDGRFVQVQRIEGVGELRSGFDGVDVWSQDPIYGDRVLRGEERAQAQWLASPVSWAKYKDYVERATTTGRRSLGDREVYEVALVIKGGTAATARFDTGTGRLVELSMEVHSPSGAQPVTVGFEEYRPVAGYEMAHVQVVTSATGVMRETYRSVVPNTSFPDDIFVRRPAAEKTQIVPSSADVVPAPANPSNAPSTEPSGG